jgi:hypothetical protein
MLLDCSVDPNDRDHGEKAFFLFSSLSFWERGRGVMAKGEKSSSFKDPPRMAFTLSQKERILVNCKERI